MKLFFLFPDNMLEYNCFLCNGVCCNLNASLQFYQEQTEKIKNFEYLEDYTKSKNGLYTLRCGKKCWFLKKNKCSLDYFCKPIDCSLYPASFWRLENYIFCEIIPCPNLKLSNNNNIKYSEIKTISERYLKYFPLYEHTYCKNINYKNKIVTIEKLESIEKWKIYLYDFIIKYNDEIKKIMLLLFTQVLAHPIVWNTLEDTKVEIFETYLKFCDKYLNSRYAANIYNIYILVRNEILKYVLNVYYFPINKNILKILSFEEKNSLRIFISNKGNIKLDYAIFKKFFDKNDTKWEVF